MHWQSKYTRRGEKFRAVFKGRPNDKCPADGYSAELELSVSLPDSVQAYDQANDERGCEAKFMRVVLRTRWVQYPQRIYMTLHEYKSSIGDIAWDDRDLVSFSPSALDDDSP